MSESLMNTDITCISIHDAACHNCCKRSIGCHSRCGEYKKWHFTRKIIALLQQSKAQPDKKRTHARKYYTDIFKNNRKYSLSF